MIARGNGRKFECNRHEHEFSGGISQGTGQSIESADFSAGIQILSVILPIHYAASAVSDCGCSSGRCSRTRNVWKMETEEEITPL